LFLQSQALLAFSCFTVSRSLIAKHVRLTEEHSIPLRFISFRLLAELSALHLRLLGQARLPPLKIRQFFS